MKLVRYYPIFTAKFLGIKEEGSQQAIVTIGANLRSAGNYHRAIANKKNTVDVENALNSLINSVSVFRFEFQ